MTPVREKTIALVDPLWIGHHPMYFTQFTAAFLRAGCFVIGLCPDPAAALADLRSALGESAALAIQHRVSFHHLPTGKRSFFKGRFEGDPLRTFLRWKSAADHLADAEAITGRRADLTFFPYLDSYMRFLPFGSIPQLTLNRPWSGLYLRNNHHGETPSLKKFIRMLAKGDDILRSPLCPGIGVLDERFIPAMERSYKKPITSYPDITQANLPAQPSALAQTILHKAAGRKIIGIIGLERRKGFLTLLRAAELSRQQGLPYYFVCAGGIHMESFTPPEITMLQSLARSCATGEIDNLHFDPTIRRIRDEADYNSLFNTFDIAWAAYENFQGSSGTLSKAAAFEIPCIATAGECVGQRVEHYHLGTNIPEGSAQAALDAFPQILADSRPRNFADYRHHHSHARLDAILADLLTAV